VPSELQYPEDAHDAEDLNESFDVVEVVGALAGFVETQRDVVGEDGEQVDGVERALEELALVGRRPQPEDVFEGEPGDAGRFEVGKVLVVRHLTVFVASLDRRQSVQGQTNGRRHDEQDRDRR